MNHPECSDEGFRNINQWPSPPIQSRGQQKNKENMKTRMELNERQ